MRLFLLIFLFSLGVSGYSNDYNYLFNRITTQDGLPVRIVDCIGKDSSGFVWVSYEGGVARFDGYRFQIFSHDPNDSSSLPIIYPGPFYMTPEENFFFYRNDVSFSFNPMTYKITKHDLKIGKITAYLRGSDSTMWIGSKDNGLIHYDKHFNIIKKYPYQLMTPLNYTDKHIVELHEDYNGDIWISFHNGEFIRLLKKTDVFKQYKNQREEDGIIKGEADILGSKANVFCQFNENEIWIGTTSGLVKFNAEKETFTHYYYKEFSINDPISTTVDHLFYHKGILWLGTSKNGILLFDTKKEAFVKHFLSRRHDDKSLIGNEIKGFYYSQKNKDGVLWIATLNGISYVDLYQKPFELYNNLKKGVYGIRSQGVRSIFVDDKYMMFGGDKGLDVINKETSTSVNYRFDKGNPNSVGAGIIGSITKINSEKYYVTTWAGSFNEFNPQKGIFKSWQAYHNTIGLTGWTFTDGCVDENDTYWLLSLEDFLFKKTAESDSFIYMSSQLKADLKHIKAKEIYRSSALPSKYFLIPTDQGLIKYDAEQNEIDQFLIDSAQPNGMCDIIFSVLIDSKDLYWIGTGGCGLIRYNAATEDHRYFTMSDGLPSNYVYAILEDDSGRLWMSTSNGISRYNPEEELFRNYYASDGLQGNEFNWGAKFKDEEGRMYFGGKDGVTAFYPSKIKTNPLKAELNFTNLYIHNRIVEVGEKVNNQLVLEENLNTLDELVIHYINNDFSVEFMSTHYANPQKNRFKYRLTGYDDEWKITTPPENRAFYGNLPPDSYTLEVLASNMDDVWGQNPRKLHIKVLPPWWQTWLFRIAFVLLFTGLLITYFKVRTRRYRKQQELLETMVKEKTSELSQKNRAIVEMAEKLHETDQSKINFLTNVSHEFRTPLTLIVGPVNNLMDNIPPSMKKIRSQLSIVQRNSHRLLRLINQLLDTSDLDAGTMKLKVSKSDVVGFVRSIVTAFEFRAKSNQIDYNIHINQGEYVGYFDGDKVEKIIYNLVSNAIKYTGQGGRIDIRCQICFSAECMDAVFELMPEKLPCLYFEVEDTGEGIPHEFLLNIFDRFYKVDHTELNKEGTGIGLSLTKQLILKHKGDIQVESHPGRGSTFRFFIPIHKACFYEDEIVYEQVDLDDKVFAIKAMDKPDNDAEPESMKNKENVLLIVEDSEDVRAYIRGYFNEHYRILEACNGKKGCEFAFKEIPDLIISDVMMPEMNGLEMCERLKRDERTSHIPLILLTAKTGEENQMKGLEYGVDDYITKPFNINALKLKIENILKRRDLLQQRILSGFDPGSVQNVSPVDEKFLSKLNAIIEARLSDTELNAEELASDICYSRSHLYRKIKALTGRNITEYIRMYRLNKAAGLIQSKAFSVSEVAYKVGYNNPSYFSKTFKELFGKSPQEYL